MRAILLAAGLGSRLKPLTNTVPKCLAPISGRPLLGVWLERLTLAGVGPFLINTHYLSEQVESFIDGSPYRQQVKLVNERELYGTAGTLIANLDFYGGEDGLLIHADNYCMADLGAFMKAHMNRPKECVMTMMTFRTENPSSCGIVQLDERGVVCGFYEKVTNPPGNLANGAAYILSPELLDRMGREMLFMKDFSVDVLPKLVGQMFSYETTEIFLDIGTPESYVKVNKLAAATG